jgi:ABC-type cobalt transport system substrate-binding protein
MEDILFFFLLFLFILLIISFFMKRYKMNSLERFENNYYNGNDNTGDSNIYYINGPYPPISTWTPYYIDIYNQPGFTNYFYRNGYMYPIY